MECTTSSIQRIEIRYVDSPRRRMNIQLKATHTKLAVMIAAKYGDPAISSPNFLARNKILVITCGPHETKYSLTKVELNGQRMLTWCIPKKIPNTRGMPVYIGAWAKT